MCLHMLGGGGVWFWQQLLWLAHIWIKHSSKTLRAIDGGFVFQLVPMQSWTTAILEGKQYSFQLQKWQAPWLFMLCSVCFVFISVLFLERPLETACPGASRSRCPRRGALCRPSALRDRRAQGALAALTARIPTKSSPRRAAPMGALPEGSRRFSCLDPAQKIFLFSSSCRFLSSASG